MHPPDDVDAGIRAWLEDDARLRHALGLEERGIDFTERRARGRRLSDALAAEHSLPVAPDCAIDDVELPLPMGSVLARVYRPRDNARALPTQLYLHGGGFAFGSVHELVGDSILSNRAVATGLQLVSLEYALAPEHPYPVARDQTVAAFAWLDAHASELRIDPQRLGLGGGSAGASIAASAALLLGRAGRQPHHLALEVPAVSISVLEAAAEAVAPEQRAELEQLKTLYLPGDCTDAFVADAESVAELPSTLIMLAAGDVLQSGGELLAERMRRAGRPVETHLALGQRHGTSSVTRTSASAREWQRVVTTALIRAYAVGGADSQPL